MTTEITTKEVTDVPTKADDHTIYFMPRVNPSEKYYLERTSRHRPWITADEQAILHGMTVGIAGCGGMGGLLAITMARTGLGEIKIADNEVFDVSNINRQVGAKRTTVGKSKALVTAADLREVTDDIMLSVYPHGINHDTVDHFLDSCDLVADEIEFWAIGARILLHQRARERGIPIINCRKIPYKLLQIGI